MLDLAALLAVAGTSIFGLTIAGIEHYLFHVSALLLVMMWIYKAWVLTDVVGTWFPARFGMNGSRVYELAVPWCIVMLGIMVVVLWVSVEMMLVGNAHATLVPIPLAVALGRITIPHLMMGWLEARRMTAGPSGGE